MYCTKKINYCYAILACFVVDFQNWSGAKKVYLEGGGKREMGESLTVTTAWKVFFLTLDAYETMQQTWLTPVDLCQDKNV